MIALAVILIVLIGLAAGLWAWFAIKEADERVLQQRHEAFLAQQRWQVQAIVATEKARIDQEYLERVADLDQALLTERERQLRSDPVVHRAMAMEAFHQLDADKSWDRAAARDAYNRLLADDSISHEQAVEAYHRLLADDSIDRETATQRYHRLLSDR